MLRGDKQLMSVVSNDAEIETQKRGHGSYTNDRDKALTCRFYYHAALLGKRYDVCLTALTKEFYLSETVIAQRLLTQQEYLKQLKTSNTSRKHLQQLYPYYIWN